MSHWHLTVGETALFVPAGVVLGAVVSYFAVRRSTTATLEVQRAALNDARTQAGEQRVADLEREERDHRRAAYAELGGHLQTIADLCNYLVPEVLGTTLDGQDSSRAVPGQTWSAFYAQILDLVPECRRLSSVYGSPDVRAAVAALSALARTLAPPQEFADGPGHWMHALHQRDSAIATELITLDGDRQLRDTMLGNIQIFGSIVRFGLAQIRYELAPSSSTKPARPTGVVEDPDSGAYVFATALPPAPTGDDTGEDE